MPCKKCSALLWRRSRAHALIFFQDRGVVRGPRLSGRRAPARRCGDQRDVCVGWRQRGADPGTTGGCCQGALSGDRRGGHGGARRASHKETAAQCNGRHERHSRAAAEIHVVVRRRDSGSLRDFGCRCAPRRRCATGQESALLLEQFQQRVGRVLSMRGSAQMDGLCNADRRQPTSLEVPIVHHLHATARQHPPASAPHRACLAPAAPSSNTRAGCDGGDRGGRAAAATLTRISMRLRCWRPRAWKALQR